MTDEERIKNLTSAIDWYEQQAMKLNAYVTALDQNRMMDVIRELAVDNGAIAREAKRC